MGSIMAVCLAIACCFVSPQQLAEATGIPMFGDMMMRALPLAISTLIAMTCTTSISLSMEGKNLWIIKSMPIEDITIYKAKLLTNLALQIPAAILAALIVNFRFPMALSMRILVFITPLSFALLSSLWGMFINLKMPDYAWTSETALVKQSLPAMAGLLGNMVIGILCAALILILHRIDAGLVTAVITVLAAACSYVLWEHIKKSKI